MDRCKSVRTLAMIAMLMLAYAGCASASFKKCYAKCQEDCRAASKEVTYCITHCIFKCIGKAESIGIDSCNNSCVVNRCRPLGDDVDKLEDCVNGCGGICA